MKGCVATQDNTQSYPLIQVTLATDICGGLIVDLVPSLLSSDSSYKPDRVR